MHHCKTYHDRSKIELLHTQQQLSQAQRLHDLETSKFD